MKRDQQRPQLVLKDFHRYSDLDGCLKAISWELGRIGITEYEMLPYQREVYSDLWSPLDEVTFANMLEYWKYNIDKLIERGRGYERGLPAKPEIDIYVELTSKGNLKAEWFPRGWNIFGPMGREYEDSDFMYWRRAESRNYDFGSRPSNELFFIHGVEYLTYSIRDPDRMQHWLRGFDHVMLRACSSVVDLMRERLERHFKVRMVSDIFVAWQESPNSSVAMRAVPRISKWEIANPEEKMAERERAQIAQMDKLFGFSYENLVGAWKDEVKRVPRSGPSPSSRTLPDRVARALKRSGFQATPSVVKRAMSLVDRHKPEDVPD